MTTSDAGLSILDRVPVDRITREARQVSFTRVLLSVIAGLFFAIGWAAAKAVGITWLTAAWCWTAIKIGWEEGRRPRQGHG